VSAIQRISVMVMFEAPGYWDWIISFACQYPLA
jgi:hypothetical protein